MEPEATCLCEPTLKCSAIYHTAAACVLHICSWLSAANLTLKMLQRYEHGKDWLIKSMHFLQANKQLNQEISLSDKALCTNRRFDLGLKTFLSKGCEDEQTTETWATKDNRRGKTSRVKTLTRNRPLCCHSHLNSCNLDLLSCTAHLFNGGEFCLRVFLFDNMFSRPNVREHCCFSRKYLFLCVGDNSCSHLRFFYIDLGVINTSFFTVTCGGCC